MKLFSYILSFSFSFLPFASLLSCKKGCCTSHAYLIISLSIIIQHKTNQTKNISQELPLQWTQLCPPVRLTYQIRWLIRCKSISDFQWASSVKYAKIHSLSQVASLELPLGLYNSRIFGNCKFFWQNLSVPGH